MMTRKKRVVFAAMICFFLFGLIELMSFTALHITEWRHPGSVLELSMARHFKEKVTKSYLKDFIERSYDPELGWTHRPFMKYRATSSNSVTWRASYNHLGARAVPVNYKGLLAATYGDSFTLCCEVQDHETWQAQASDELNALILNFGVSVYGTFQAVLRLERHLSQGLTAPVTILGIYESNLERAVMSFRPFKYRNSRPLGFKPTLRYRNGRIETFRNPWTDPAMSRQELEALALSVAEYDYFAQDKARMSFPFSLSAARSLLASMIRYYRQDLWHSAEGRKVMIYLVDRFIKRVKGHGSVPVVLFLPGRETLRKDRPSRYALVRDALRKRHRDIAVLDVNEHEFDRQRYNVAPFKGHASVYGNRIIATIVARALTKIEPVEHSLGSFALAR